MTENQSRFPPKAADLRKLSTEEQDQYFENLIQDRSILRIINSFAIDLIAIPTKEDLAWYIAREVVAKMGFIDCIVFYIDHDKKVLRQSSIIGKDTPIISDLIANPMEIDIEQGIVGRVTRTRKPMIVNNLEVNDLYIPGIDNARSEICVPLIDGDEIFGVIDCENPNPNHFTTEHLDILTTVAAMASAKLRSIKQDERLELMTKLNEAENRFRDFAEASADWFWELDQDLKYIYFSPKMENHENYPNSFFVGKFRADVKPKDIDEDLWQSHMDDLSAHRPFENFVQSRPTKAGVRIWQSIGGVPFFDDQGTFKGYRGTGTDITSRMDAVRGMGDALEQAERASQAKSQFPSSMSHELRTLMNAIMGFAEILKINPDEPLTNYQGEAVDQILMASNQLLGLINQVLELSSIEDEKLPIDLRDTSAKTVIENSLGMIRARADRDGIAILDQTIGVDLPTLWADGNRLTQALLNLLSNAVKYNREDGKVILTCQETPDRKFRINVADNGRGIPMELQGGLFKPFERLGYKASNIEGAGIGLTVAPRIVALLGGKIGYESEENKGSTFWMDIPLCHVAEPDSRGAPRW